MAITPITNYEDRAESLVPEFLKRDEEFGDKSFFVLEVRAFAAQVQILEDAAMDVYLYRGIDSALVHGAANGFGNNATTNPILDGIGDIVGQPRNLMTNVQYAVMIKAKIQMNATQGEPERIIAALQAITTIPGNTPKKVNYFNSFPAGVTLVVENPDTILFVSDRLHEIMESVLSGGVSVSIVKIGSDTRPFCFSLDGINPYYSYGKGFGNNNADPNGGQLAYPI
jgi:hypothetical protein